MKVFSTVSLEKNQDLSKIYIQTHSLYLEPPKDEISLEEFKNLAIERVKLLREIDLM